MTIRKGEPWGTTGPAPSPLREVGSDAELHRLVNECRVAGEPIPAVALLGGDLMRAVGGTGDRTRLAGDVARLPVDVVRVEAEGRTAWFVAHALARRPTGGWTGEIVAVLNGEFIGDGDVAPRAHPNDGRVDVVRVAATMSWRDRWRARRRLPSGSHLPHPSIEVRQVSTHEIAFAAPMRLRLDGVPWGSARAITVTVEPDALIVVV